MSPNPREDGFTLVELLIVMVIIGVLAAIALPAFLSQRDRAFAATMKSDLRSAVTAELAHAAGNAGFTAAVDDLTASGYRPSPNVTPVHVRLVGQTFVACVKHTSAKSWLVYDGASGETSSADDDCA